MTFQQLTYLVEVSKRGSINKAAQSLFVSQSGISTAISDLEKELGIIFFERSSRGVTLTNEGSEFISYANSILEQKKWVVEMYKGTKAKDELQTLSISSQRYPFVEEAVLKFVQDHSDNLYRYTFKSTEVNAIIDDVYDHRADVGFLFLQDSTSKLVRHLLLTRNLTFHPLVSVRPSVYIRKSHPLASHREIGEDELLQYPYLAFDHKHGLTADFLEEYQTIKMKKTRKFISVSERSLSYALLNNTDCYTTGSGLLVEELESNLITRPIKGASPIEVGWISPNDTKLSNITLKFIDYVTDYLNKSVAYTLSLRGDSEI